MTSHALTWLDEFVLDGNNLFTNKRGVSLGAVLIITSQKTGRVVLVRKAPKPGYEFERLWVFPGGMLRGNGNSISTPRQAFAGLTARVEAECGIKFDETHIDVLSWYLAPLTTEYSVKGQRKFSAVVPFGIQLLEEVQVKPIENRSVDAAAWQKLSAVTVEQMAPANSLIAIKSTISRTGVGEEILALKTLARDAAIACGIAEQNCGYGIGNAAKLAESIVNHAS
jgi:8-oxo-dGTP pyrophosphatase MutT (NUDIX family)